jgi:TetR/AcrR family transcriptional repressor of nem operon
MGREKQYNRSELLEKAVGIFRKNGYHATSTEELTGELGINKKTMYAEFGSKLKLFENTLHHYDQTFLTEILRPIEEEGAGADGIKKVFHGIAQYGQKELKGLGCLLCNTSTERNSLDSCIGPAIDRYYERINKGFQHALKNWANANSKKSQIDVSRTAAFLTTSLIGMATSVRAEAPASQLKGTCRFIDVYIDSLI